MLEKTYRENDNKNYKEVSVKGDGMAINKVQMWYPPSPHLVHINLFLEPDKNNSLQMLNSTEI